MDLRNILGNEKVTLSFEVFPPKSNADFEKIKEAAYKVAALKPSFMSVTYGAGGSTQSNTISIASGIQNEYNVPVIAHLTCVGATKDSIQSALTQMQQSGVKNILALRGDRPSWMEGDPFIDYHYAYELVETIKSYGDFCVGGACYPECHPESATKKDDVEYLKRKVDAGCEFLTSQMFFDNNIFYNFLYRVRDAGIEVPIIPGIMPITRAKQVENAVKLSGCNVPERFKNIVDRFGNNKNAMEQAGVVYATEQIIDLIANGVNNIHIYSMNNAGVVQGILTNLSEIVG